MLGSEDFEKNPLSACPCEVSSQADDHGQSECLRMNDPAEHPWQLPGQGGYEVGLERLRRRVLEVGGKPGGGRRALYLTTQPFQLMSSEVGGKSEWIEGLRPEEEVKPGQRGSVAD